MPAVPFEEPLGRIDNIRNTDTPAIDVVASELVWMAEPDNYTLIRSEYRPGGVGNELEVYVSSLRHRQQQ